MQHLAMHACGGQFSDRSTKKKSPHRYRETSLCVRVYVFFCVVRMEEMWVRPCPAPPSELWSPPDPGSKEVSKTLFI